NAVTGEAGKEKIDAADVKVKTKDPDSQIEISLDGDQATAILTYTVDTDADKQNGRLYLEDRFVFDPKAQKLIDVKRSFRMGAGAAGLANWGSLYGRLKKLEENSPLTVQDPVVTKFFKDVVLQIPEPSEDSAPSTAATPAPIPKTEPASPMGSLTAIRSLTPAL